MTADLLNNQNNISFNFFNTHETSVGFCGLKLIQEIKHFAFHFMEYTFEVIDFPLYNIYTFKVIGPPV